MDNNLRRQQVEALEVLLDYNIRLIKSIKLIIAELTEERKQDTDEFQNKIIEGINWEIEILNRTLSLINEKEERINKSEINNHIITLDNALKSGNDIEIAKVFENNIFPTFNKISEIVESVINQQK